MNTSVIKDLRKRGFNVKRERLRDPRATIFHVFDVSTGERVGTCHSIGELVARALKTWL